MDHRYVRFPDSGNDYLQADVKVGDDHGAHLFGALADIGHFGPPAAFPQGSRPRRSGRARDRRIGAQQPYPGAAVREIRAVIDSTHYPVIVAGDFNDTPSSYTYRRLKGDMTDGFRAVGNGFGGTFRLSGRRAADRLYLL